MTYVTFLLSDVQFLLSSDILALNGINAGSLGRERVTPVTASITVAPKETTVTSVSAVATTPFFSGCCRDSSYARIYCRT